jgi:hypothetical protein
VTPTGTSFMNFVMMNSTLVSFFLRETTRRRRTRTGRRGPPVLCAASRGKEEGGGGGGAVGIAGAGRCYRAGNYRSDFLVGGRPDFWLT